MAKNKEEISLREKLTDSIMKSKFADDEPKYQQSNENFLNTLTIDEPQAMCDEDFEVDEIDDNEAIDEQLDDDFDAYGEVTVDDFSDEEYYNSLN